jgi:sugar phosphate permease
MLVSLLASLPGAGLTQQALVLTGVSWLGMLMLGFHSDLAYRRWRVLEALAALLAVATIVACTMLLGLMPYSDAALLGGVSLLAGALAVGPVRRRLAARQRASLVPAAVPIAWDEPVEEHVA